MDLSFQDDVKPAKGVPVLLFKEPTGEGDPCQVHCIVEFQDAAGAKIRRKRMIISDGTISEWVNNGWMTPPEDYNPEEHNGLGWPQFKFQQLWNAVPEVSQQVLEAVEAQMPGEAIKQLWNRG